jgi:hypothetical protein
MDHHYSSCARGDLLLNPGNVKIVRVDIGLYKHGFQSIIGYGRMGAT